MEDQDKYQEQDHLEQLADIRDLMERSTRFISLSGLSGVSTGLIALAGSIFAWSYMDYKYEGEFDRAQLFCKLEAIPMDYILKLGAAAGFVLVLALGSAIFFTTRKARKQGLPIWDRAAQNMLINLSIPLITGGLFCLVLLKYEICGLIAPATLIFYGLALINASKFTLKEIRYLGITEIVLGFVACFMLRESLIFWGLGFGVLHIFYGILMYYRYER